MLSTRSMSLFVHLLQCLFFCIQLHCVQQDRFRCWLVELHGMVWCIANYINHNLSWQVAQKLFVNTFYFILSYFTTFGVKFEEWHAEIITRYTIYIYMSPRVRYAVSVVAFLFQWTLYISIYNLFIIKSRNLFP